MPSWFTVALTLLVAGGALSSTSEKQLLVDLLKYYNILERPVEHDVHNITVKAGLSLEKVIDLDIDRGQLKSYVWITMSWSDSNLQWNPLKYNNITALRLPAARVWNPDMKFYNAMQEDIDMTQVIVYSSGIVMHVPPATITTTCKANARWFPFDRHHCNITFASWTYDAFKVDWVSEVTPHDDDDIRLVEGVEWRIKSVKQQRNVKYYKCCIEPYSSLTATVVLQRKPAHYMVSVFIPMLCIVLLALISSVVPTERADLRLVVSILLILSAGVNLNVVKTGLPKSVTIMDIYNGQMMTILFAVISINCVHLALQRCCKKSPTFTKLSGIMHSESAMKFAFLSASKGSIPSENGKQDFIVEAEEDTKEEVCHQVIDRISLIVLTALTILNVLFFCLFPLATV